MKYRRPIAIVFALLGLMMTPAMGLAETIHVSAAISLREAVTDAAKSFEAETGDHVDFTFGASGQLAAQITNGANVDAFISAAEKQVGDLTRAGLVVDGSRRVVAGNSLVLVVPADAGDSAPSGFEHLADAGTKRLAVGEPKTVPAGDYAMQTLRSLHIADALNGRLVYGANVRQVLDYVERGEVSAGLVYATDAKEAGDKVHVVATAEKSTHEPIIYPAVILKSSSHADVADRFFKYLTSSEKGRAALSGRGFTFPTTRPADSSAAPKP
jgi:molybdate transport system substrate-binding protein